MVIGFDGSRAFTGEKTGTENYSYQLLKHLLKIDRKNRYIVYLRKEASSAYLRSGIVIARSETTKQSLPENVEFKTINWPRLWTQIGLALKTFTDHLDVLFVPSHTLPILRKPGLKTVMTVHDLGVEYLPKMHQLKQQLYLKYITRYQLTSATRLIAVSKATKRDLVKKVGIDEKKISVVYEGYDNEMYNVQFKIYNSDRLINSLKQYDLVSGKYFLFVGTVQPRKNLERIIVAFSHQLTASRQKQKKSVDCSLSAVDLNLVIAGSKGWLYDDIYELPKKLGIRDRVKFLGYVPEKEMPNLYQNALGLVFPSLFEGFGLPILEAQASGCPVLTSNTSSMPEVAGKGAILVDPYSVDDIVKGMERLQGTAGPRRGGLQLIRAGFENVKKFSWEKTASETLKILEEVVNG